MNSSNFIQTVALKSVKYYAYHGFYPEENVLGQYYLVDVEVKFYPGIANDDLSQSVNYEVLNQIILEEMKISRKLLETVVQAMMQRILKQFNYLIQVEIGLHKLQPPMPGEVGESYVSLSYVASNN